jgi:hypothetical protein
MGEAMSAIGTKTLRAIETGAVAGGVRGMLRLEGVALAAAALAAYAATGAEWKTFALLFLVPDLSFVAFMFGPRIGAAAYNAMHATPGPLALGAAALVLHQPFALSLALIWMAHVGFDRAFGYGLKYASGFRDTHLGRIGRTTR